MGSSLAENKCVNNAINIMGSCGCLVRCVARVSNQNIYAFIPTLTICQELLKQLDASNRTCFDTAV